MNGNNEEEEVRASVLEAALELGVESHTFSEWLNDNNLDYGSGKPNTGGGMAKQPFPFTASTGDSHYPFISNSSQTTYLSGRQNSSSDILLSTPENLITRNPSTSSSFSHDHSSSSSHSYQSAPPRSRKTSDAAPSAWKTSEYMRHRKDSDTPPFASYRPPGDDGFMPIPAAPVEFPSSKMATKKEEKKRLKKKKPSSRDGYESDGSSIFGKFLGRKSSSSRPSTPPPVPIFPEGTETRTRATSEFQRRPSVPTSFPLPPAQQLSPTGIGDVVHSPVIRVKARPSTASSAENPVKKSKGFRWGFKRSQSHPDLHQVAQRNGSSVSLAPSTSQMYERPPLPSLQVSGFGTNVSDRSPSAQIAFMQGALRNSPSAMSPYDLGSGIADPRNRHRQEATPTTKLREERMNDWAENRAGIGARGFGGAVYFGNTSPSLLSTTSGESPPRGPSFDSQRTAKPATPDSPLIRTANTEREGSIRSEITIKPAVDLSGKYGLEEVVSKRDVNSLESIRNDTIRRSASLTAVNSTDTIDSTQISTRSKPFNLIPLERPISVTSIIDDVPNRDIKKGGTLPPLLRDSARNNIPPSPGPTGTLPPHITRAPIPSRPSHRPAVMDLEIPRSLGLDDLPPRHMPWRSPNTPDFSHGSTTPRLSPAAEQQFTPGSSSLLGPSPLRSPVPLTPDSLVEPRVISKSPKGKYRDLALALAIDLPAAPPIPPRPESVCSIGGIDIPDYLHPDEEYEEPVNDTDSVLSVPFENRFSAGAGFGGISLEDLTRSSMHAPIFKNKKSEGQIFSQPYPTGNTSQSESVGDHTSSHRRKNTEPSFLSFDEEPVSPSSSRNTRHERPLEATDKTQTFRRPRFQPPFPPLPHLTSGPTRSVSISKWL